jgi:hypothetical protein
MSGLTEIFKLDDGTEVGTGCLLPTAEEFALAESSYKVFGGNEILDDKDCEKLLKDNRYKTLREKRRKRMLNQARLGKCFPPGTLIRMADGSQKPIEEVKLLDKVLTGEGRVRTVIRTMVRPHAGEVLRICAWGNRHVRCTAEHPFLTKRGYVAAEDLREGDWLCMPRFAPQSVSIIEPFEIIGKPLGYKKQKHERQAVGRTFIKGIPGKQSSFADRKPLPELIELDHEFGWVVGLLLAEGSLHYGKLQYCLAKHEEDTLAAKTIEIFQRRFGVELTKVMRANECQLKLYGVHWVKMFYELCGAGCKSRNIHSKLMSGPADFLRGMLEGWQAGDGLGSPGLSGGVTISHSLAMNMFDIATYLGYEPTIETLKVKVNPKHKIKERQTRYIVKWPKERKGELSPRFESEESRVWRKFHKTEAESYSGWVYNLEVEDDHSYVAEGLAVHNCNASATVSGAHQATETSGQPVKVFSDCHLYMRINGGRDSGSGLIQGMKEMETGGLAFRELEDGGERYMIPHNVYNKSQIPARWLSVANREAKKNLGFELQIIPSKWSEFVPAVKSAIARDYPIINAWDVGGASMRLNNGYINQGGGRGNHATLAHSGKWVGGRDGVHPDIQNSWGPSPDAIFGPVSTSGWGEAGFGLMTMEEFFQCRQTHVFWVFVNIALRNENNPLLN